MQNALQLRINSEEDKLISGTYLHPDLIPDVAGWISAQFQN